MFERSPEAVLMTVPPWPTYLISNFRQFEPNERHITRISSDYVLLFMLENTLHFTEAGTDVELRAGEWYIQVPGLRQEGGKGSPAPFYYYIHFSAASVPYTPEQLSSDAEGESANDRTNRLVLPVRGRFEPNRMRPWLDRLDEVSKRRPTDFLGAQSVFLDLLSRISSAELSSEMPSRRIAHEIIGYLSANYNRHLNGNQLSSHFHYSYDYIQRLLKKYFNVTPGQYIQEYRVKRAQELLENSDLSIPAIAAEVGYNDETVFYKAFRKLTGDAPGVWRRKKRGLM
ncbi:helix-turn-helix domain-containing protein [Paenibacillus thermotolerans]|uniref:helix-turn-helix domain-containing protein n=1 Tax=Paenibacillus thermotolerans TaxID=3027807 RepID=UPI0023684397|nr:MULTISPECIES: AraC family transcriptional regulator [unclassified Paenibacillus]